MIEQEKVAVCFAFGLVWSGVVCGSLWLRLDLGIG